MFTKSFPETLPMHTRGKVLVRVRRAESGLRDPLASSSSEQPRSFRRKRKISVEWRSVSLLRQTPPSQTICSTSVLDSGRDRRTGEGRVLTGETLAYLGWGPIVGRGFGGWVGVKGPSHPQPPPTVKLKLKYRLVN